MKDLRPIYRAVTETVVADALSEFEAKELDETGRVLRWMLAVGFGRTASLCFGRAHDSSPGSN